MGPVRCFTFVVTSSTLALSMTTGCADRPAHATMPTTQELTSEITVKPFVTHTENLPVKEGMPPLFYLAETPGFIRVIDTNTKTSVGEVDAAAHAIVSIDTDHGVSIAGVTYTQGPLPENHRYQIYFSAGGENPVSEIRSGIVRSRPSVFDQTNKSTTQPGSLRGGATTAPSSP